MKQNNPPAIAILKNPIHFLAFGFGSGLSPVAPGTAGTVVAIPIYYLLVSYLSNSLYLLVLGLMFVVGVFLCHQSAKALNVHDHPGIVWDEFVGFLITMIAAPLGWMWVLLGFVLFRFFDIVKPWPIKTIDKKVGGGFGIMLDDVLAGVYAWIVLQILANSIMGIAPPG